MPNDRQLAVLIWLGVAAVFMLVNGDLRRSLRSMIRAVLARKVAIVFVAMMLWVAGELVIARRLSWWDTSMTTSTVFWLVGSGFVLFINTPKSAEEEHFFRRSFLTAIKLSVFLGVFMNLFVLNLPAELLLQIALFLLFAMSAVASQKDEFQHVKKLVDVVIGITLVGLVTYEITSIATHWSTISHSGLAWQFFLPVWLTLGLLPFIYVAGVYSQYELAFLRAEWTTGLRWGRRWALVASFGLQSHKLHSYITSSAYRLLNTSSFSDARRAIRETPEDDSVDEDVDEASSVQLAHAATSSRAGSKARRMACKRPRRYWKQQDNGEMANALQQIRKVTGSSGSEPDPTLVNLSSTQSAEAKSSPVGHI